MSENLSSALEALRQALKERLVAVILFGSRARRDASEASDWDLLIIAEGLPSKTLERYFFIKQLLPAEWRGRVSLLIRTPEALTDHLSSLHLDIALDGQILFDPFGYAIHWVTTLRRFIQQAGLFRERTEIGDVWRQKEAPAASP